MLLLVRNFSSHRNGRRKKQYQCHWNEKKFVLVVNFRKKIGLFLVAVKLLFQWPKCNVKFCQKNISEILEFIFQLKKIFNRENVFQINYEFWKINAFIKAKKKSIT